MTSTSTTPTTPALPDPREQELAAIYHSVSAGAPSVTGGSLAFRHNSAPTDQPSVCTVQLQMSVKDVTVGKAANYLTSFSANYPLGGNGSSNSDGFVQVSFPTELGDTVLRSVSPSGTREARVVKYMEADKQQFRMEIWAMSGLLFSVDTSGIHGKMLSDAIFKALSWSPDEKFLAYVAEQTRPTYNSFWKRDVSDRQVVTGDAPAEPTPPPKPRGKEFDYVEEWGEQYVGFSFSKVFIVDLEHKNDFGRPMPKIYTLKGLPEGIAAGQPVFLPDNQGIVFTGWETTPRRFGLIFCYNRRSALYHATPEAWLTPKEGSNFVTKLTGDEAEDWATRSPRLTPDGKSIVYLSIRETHRHNTASLLRLMNWSDKKKRTILDTVQVANGDDEFPSLFCHAILERAFTSDSKSIILNTQWRSRIVVLQVSLEQNDRIVPLPLHTRIANGDTSASYYALDVVNDHLLFMTSSHAAVASVHVSALTSSTSSQVLNLDSSSLNVDYKLVPLLSPAPGPQCRIEGVLAAPKSDASESKPRPLVVIPHGGPHGSYSTTFLHSNNFLHRLGYATLQVNYRGSNGFGLQNLECLSGHVGTIDIVDTYELMQHVVRVQQDDSTALLPGLRLDSSKLYYFGGSHGGFIGGHMICQYPELFCAAVLHNPVTNLITQLATSDIADWGCSVAGLPLECAFTGCPPSELARLQHMSPVGRMGPHVKTPTLFKVGAVDLRCPSSQALEMYHSLRHHGVSTRMLWYPTECHPIGGVAEEASSWINAILWFEKYNVSPPRKEEKANK